MMADQTPVLYSYFRSSCAWRVRFAMALKGIEYETIPVNIMNNEQHSEWFVKVNPMAQVPALVIDGHTLVQSASILEYLEETRPEPSLFANGDSFLRAQIREICETIGSGIQPLQNPFVCREIGDESKQKAFVVKFINKGLTAVEQLLTKTASKYCVGDSVTLADCYLVPQVYNANRYNIDVSQFPVISRIVKSLEELKEHGLSHPSAQQDCPPDFHKV